MVKKKVSWIELIKIVKSRPEHKGHGLKEVIGDAKKEWVQIKACKHPDYEQGKSKPTKRKRSKKNKTEKVSRGKGKGKGKGNGRGKGHGSNMVDLDDLLRNCKLTKKCKKEILKYANSQRGGDGCEGLADCEAFNLPQGKVGSLVSGATEV